MNSNKNFVPALILTAAAAGAPGIASAELSANIGWVSEYLYRGVYQDDSSASAGIDYEHDGGFYAGAWGADVGSGLEYDLYAGYEGGEDFTYSIGYTAYRYTGPTQPRPAGVAYDDYDDGVFDNFYDEVNLGVGYGIFALDVAVGQYDSQPEESDYTFTSITISPEMGPYFKFGSYSQDFDGDYFEIGYSYNVEEHDVDLSIALVTSDDLIVTNPADGDTGEYALTFGITKNIGFGE